ncbi:DNA sulfur modification protein DndE [Salipaludibacillus daqingensis]|uniref:DNA sulfur modification protein DndE n=1 Tax=Salipaludibacillus daqingensis TaxID=3041001 RepID=UPI0024751823|nr:DNA sulfur modification protein DndE [Salipaludibacillus daqingensis]
MNFRLKTSKYAEEKLKQLQAATGITPNILSRIAVSLSLNDQSEVTADSVPNANGQEFNRNTLTGEYDYVYNTLIAQHAKREVKDEEYFPGLFNAHLERGIRMLSNEYQYAGNYEKLITNLIKDH